MVNDDVYAMIKEGMSQFTDENNDADKNNDTVG